MLTKKRVDKKLGKYIQGNLSYGYSKHAIKEVLVKHGFEESYVKGLLRKYSELKFVKLYSIIVYSIFITSFLGLNFYYIINDKQKITGYAAVSSEIKGCCSPLCQETTKEDCYGNFFEDSKCSDLKECSIGCCVDNEGQNKAQ